MQEQGNHNSLLHFQVSRSFLSLAKNFLFMLQDLKDQGKISQDDFITMRSKILGNTNDSIRFLEQMLDLCSVEVKKT